MEVRSRLVGVVAIQGRSHSRIAAGGPANAPEVRAAFTDLYRRSVRPTEQNNLEELVGDIVRAFLRGFRSCGVVLYPELDEATLATGRLTEQPTAGIAIHWVDVPGLTGEILEVNRFGWPRRPDVLPAEFTIAKGTDLPSEVAIWLDLPVPVFKTPELAGPALRWA